MLSESVLSRCEKEVLSVIYDSEERLGLKEVVELVNEKYNHAWRPQTVSTFLNRAVKKGYLKGYRKGRQILYIPSVDFRIEVKNELMDIAQLFFNGDLEKLKEFIDLELWP